MQCVQDSKKGTPQPHSTQLALGPRSVPSTSFNALFIIWCLCLVYSIYYC